MFEDMQEAEAPSMRRRMVIILAVGVAVVVGVVVFAAWQRHALAEEALEQRRIEQIAKLREADEEISRQNQARNEAIRKVEAAQDSEGAAKRRQLLLLMNDRVYRTFGSNYSVAAMDSSDADLPERVGDLVMKSYSLISKGCGDCRRAVFFDDDDVSTAGFITLIPQFFPDFRTALPELGFSSMVILSPTTICTSPISGDPPAFGVGSCHPR